MGRAKSAHLGDYHKCELEDREEFLYTLPPNASAWAKCWETNKRHSIVNPRHPFTKEYFRSQTTLAKERRRHLLTKRYRHIVHPFSNIAMFHSMFMAVLFLVLFFLDPLYCTLVSVRMYGGVPCPVLDLVQLTLNFMVLFDIAINFFLGYAIEQSREVILESRSIALRYLKTYFVVDVLVMLHSIVPLVVAQTSTVALFAKLLVIARLVRIGTFLKHLSFTFKFLFKLNDTNMLVVQMLFVKTIIIHWCVCYFAVLPTVTTIMGWSDDFSWMVDADAKTGGDIRKDLVVFYLECLLVIMCHFYGAGHATFKNYAMPEMILLCLVILIGMCFAIYAVAVVSEAFGAGNTSSIKYDEMISQIKEYVTTKKLPPVMMQRLAVYYEYKFQRRFFWEHAILNSLSEHLQLEVVLYSCKHLIERVDIFRGMSKAAIGTIISMLRQDIYLPGDVIYSSKHGPSRNYHLISYGTVAIFLDMPDGTVEFGHFEDGDHLGDTSETFRTKYDLAAHTVAIEICDVYSLSKTDMAYCIKMFPELRSRIINILRGRLEFCDRVLATDRSAHQDILSQLKSGKILNKGKKR